MFLFFCCFSKFSGTDVNINEHFSVSLTILSVMNSFKKITWFAFAVIILSNIAFTAHFIIVPHDFYFQHESVAYAQHNKSGHSQKNSGDENKKRHPADCPFLKANNKQSVESKVFFVFAQPVFISAPFLFNRFSLENKPLERIVSAPKASPPPVS